MRARIARRRCAMSEIATELVVVKQHPSGVRQVLLNDPAGRNALDDNLRTHLAVAISRLTNDKDARAFVIGSSGKNFSVGGDLGKIAGYEPGQSSHAQMTVANAVAVMIANCGKPVVAAVTGHAVGAGAGLAL